MKYFSFLLALFFSCSNLIFAQVEVSKGITDDPKGLEKLKATKTIYIYQDRDTADLFELVAALKQAWTFTEIDIAPVSEIDKYMDGDFSVISATASPDLQKWGSDCYSYLELYIPSKGGKKKDVFGRIAIHPSYKSVNGMWEEKHHDVTNLLHSQAHYYNVSPGHLRCYLTVMNELLVSGKKLMMDKYTYDEVNIKALQNSPLVIPDYALIEYDVKGSVDEGRHDPKELFKLYPYDYKIVKTSTLREQLLDPEEPFYFLSYAQLPMFKYVAIINGKTGELVYQKFQGDGNLKYTDFQQIARVVK